MGTKISLYGETFEISEEQMQELIQKRGFQYAAENYARMVQQYYEKCGSLEKVIKTLPEKLAKLYYTVSENAVDILAKQYGIYTEDESTIFQKIQELHGLEAVKALDDMNTYFLECMGEMEQASAYRQARKNARTQIRGGGFSLTGLAKGMAIAGVINLTTGAAHSIYNAIDGVITDNSIQSKIDAFYKKPLTKNMLCAGVYNDVYHISDVILHCIGIRRPYYTEGRAEQAGRLFTAIKKKRVPFHELRSSMATVLRDDPFNLPAFHFAVKVLGDEGLSDYADFLGYEDVAKNIKQLSSGENRAIGNDDSKTELILVNPPLMRETLERLRNEGGKDYFFHSFGPPLVYYEGLTVGFEAAFEAAEKTYAPLQEGEVPLLCYDTSAYDKNKTHGVLITNAGLHHQSISTDIFYPQFVPYNQIEKIVIGSYDIEIYLKENNKIMTRDGRQIVGNKMEVAKLDDIAIPLKNIMVALTNTARKAYENLGYTSIWISKAKEKEIEAPASSLTVEAARIIKAPMPGEILQVFVSEGEYVKMGQRLMTINAMNIINEILADRSGFVQALHVRSGHAVKFGNPLVEIGEEKPQRRSAGNPVASQQAESSPPIDMDTAYSIYAKGRELEEAGKYQKAAQYYAQAANGGNCAAMLAIADMCLEGRGVMKEIDKGRAWLQQAAIRGSTEAKERLAALDGTPIVYETPKVEKRPSPKSPAFALLLCLFNLAGLAGLHRFYVGRWFSGILYLFTFGFFGLGSLFDLFMILTGSFCDDDDLPLKWG